MKFNLLFITSVNVTYPGGVERWLKELSQLLRSRGHSIKILQTNWIPHTSTMKPKKIEIQNITIRNCQYLKIPMAETVIIDPINVIKILRELINQNNIDLLYHLIYPPNENILSYILKVYRITAIAGVHFTFLTLMDKTKWKLYFPVFLKGLKQYNIIHVLNHQVYDYLEKLGFSNVYFIPNGIDTSKFYVDAADVFKVYWSGRFTYDKGADIAIDIVRAFNDRYSREVGREVLFVFSGTGDKKYEEKLKKLSKKYNNVKYLGLVPETLLPQCYATSNLFLVTSRIEGMPMRVLEATASGLPVVGSNIPGVIEILRTTKVGCLVNPNDVNAFIRAIRKFFELWKENPSYYLHIKKNIRNRTIMNYDWRVILPRIERMLANAITS
ncbi:MAG: glycosyltransferase family 4 protein [Desulfurococcaceae archaeon]